MEPTDLTPSSPEDTALEKLLAQPGKGVADEGFTLRVMHALPATPKPVPARRQVVWRFFPYVIGLIVGLVLSWSSFSDSSQWQVGPSLATLLTESNLTILGVIVASIAIAYSGDLMNWLRRHEILNTD